VRSGQVPKTIQKWIDLNYDLIEDFHMECDGYGGPNQGDYSIWMYLVDGLWNTMTETSMIHAATVRDFMEETRCIEPWRAA